MSIVHAYSQTVADGTATSVVRPSDWNSAHNMVLNMGGNTAGTSQISGQDIVWAGGNNVTLSANGSTVTIVGPNTVAQTVQTQASGNIVGAGFTSTTTAGTAVVATQNSAGLSMAVPAYLTTAAQSNHSHNFATTTTGGSNIVVGTTNSAGATIGVPAFITTYANDLTSGRAGTGTTLGFTGGVTGSMTLNTNGLNLQLSELAGTDTWYATGANTIAGTATSGTFSNDGYVVSGAGGVSIGVSSNTLVISGGGGTINQTGPNIAVAGSTITSGDVVFSNSNGVTFGMNGSTITASVAGGGGGGTTIGNMELFYQVNTVFTTHGIGTIYFQKFVPQQNVSFNNIERRASGSTVSNAASADCAYTITYGIYSQQGGASTSQYSLMGSSSMHIRAAFSSNTSCGITISGNGTSYVSASAGTGAMSLLSGYKHLYFPFTSTLNAGNNYAFAQVWSSATTGGTSALRLGQMDCSNVNNLTVGKFFYSTFQATAASNIGDFGQGVYSSSSNGLPNTIALSGFTNAVSQNRMYLQFD